MRVVSGVNTPNRVFEFSQPFENTDFENDVSFPRIRESIGYKFRISWIAACAGMTKETPKEWSHYSVWSAGRWVADRAGAFGWAVNDAPF